jgi:threonine/homoserine/homoserine lactone efflux protein
MTVAGLISYSSALAIAALIPGPQIFALFAQAVQRGLRQATWMTLGMVLGDLAYLSLVLAGLAILAETVSWALIVIKWAGIAYLAWLAMQFWIAPVEPSDFNPVKTKSNKHVFISGFFITMGNPKSIFFYISLMPTIIAIQSITRFDATILLLVTGTILTVVQFGFVLAASRTRNLFHSQRNLRVLNRSAAVCMGGAAAAIALRD